MDHEISSSQLGEGLEGWDWTCMQLNDGTEVKAYRLRKDDGSSDRWSAVYWIDQAGQVEQVYADKFSWNEEDRWESSKTGLTYPTMCELKLSIQQRVYKPTHSSQCWITRNFTATVQTMPTGKVPAKYWIPKAVIGKAYLELAGYGGGLGARLN